MGEPDEKMKIFHVAGTNGKGSVCAFLQSVLTKAGYRVGTFTSPHLIETRERFGIDGRMVSEEAFEESCRTIRTITKKMMVEGFCHPSYFEFLFYMAMDLYDKEKMDFVILETGLGGRLDTTNVIRTPLVSVITSISLDHTEYLGDTIDKIASEKAGIIKRGIPVVFDGNNRTASLVIRNRAIELNAPFYEVNKQDYKITGYGENGYMASFFGIKEDSLEVMIPSSGEYQVMNAILSYRALEAAGLKKALGPEIGKEQIKDGFRTMRWPARMEEVLPGVFLDGAHNPGGIEAFVKAAAGLCTARKKRAYLLFSAVSGKNHVNMIKKISEALPLDKVAVTHIDSERGLETEILLKEFRDTSGCGAEGFQKAEAAVLYMLQQKDEGHLLFCVGSLYLMGEIKEVLRRNGYD